MIFFRDRWVWDKIGGFVTCLVAAGFALFLSFLLGMCTMEGFKWALSVSN